MPPAIKNVLEAWSQPTVILSAIGLVVGNLAFALWWANEQSSRISENANAINALRNDVRNMNTPLAARVLQLEGRVQTIAQQFTDLATRVGRIDDDGTRKALAFIEVTRINMERNTVQIDRLINHAQESDRRDNELNTLIRALDVRLERLERATGNR